MPLDGAEGDEVGILVFDRDGRLLHLTAYARKLLLLAQHPRIDRLEMRRAGSRVTLVPTPLWRLCISFARSLAAGRTPDSPPVWSTRNAWGRIVFRAYPFETEEAASGLIGVAVRHEVPRIVKLWRRVAGLSLPRRQAQVCFHLANGLTYSEIARRLGVSVDAVGWHVRELYGRLGVHSNAELRQRLENGD